MRNYMDEISKDYMDEISDFENQLEWERIKEEQKNEYILKTIKKIKEIVFWVEDTTLDDVKGIIKELENEVGEI